MELRDRYKKTDAGIIPDDWNTSQLENLCKLGSGTTPPRSMHDRYFGDGTIPWVKTLDLNNSFIVGTSESVTEYALKETSLKVYPINTILVAMYGGYNQIGRTGYLKGPAAVNQALTALQSDNRTLDSGYLLHTLNYKIEYWKTVASSSRKDPNITSLDVKRFPIAFPSVAEQTAIANALSDADALIGSLQKLIAKKRQIKQGAMQTLLVGKNRLAKFIKSSACKNTEIGQIPEDWDCIAMGEIGQPIIGLTYSPKDVREYGTLVLRSSNIQDGKLAYENNVFVDMDLPSRVMVEQGDILICVRNGSRQLIGKCALIDETAKGAAFGAFMSIFRSKFSKFVFYQFQSNIIQRQINEVMGATINQLTNKDLSIFKIAMPRDELEQNHIVTILSDMDAEIAALETKLTKYQQIKQGMMQNLLTGRIRLV